MIAGVGNGNMNKASVDAAAAAVKKGVKVVRSSRVATGSQTTEFVLKLRPRERAPLSVRVRVGGDPSRLRWLIKPAE